MSGHLEISKAILSRLTAASPGAAISSSLIKYENLNPGGAIFAPPTTSGALWYRAWFMPGEPVAAELGEAAMNRQVGVFQVDVLQVGTGKGTAATDAEVERLRACFARGTILISGSVNVKCKKAYLVRPTQDESAYYKQILRVSWEADIAN